MEISSNSDRLIISLIFIAAFIGLLMMTEIRLTYAVPFVIIASGLSWLYIRTRTRRHPVAETQLTHHDIENIRSELLTNITDALPRAIIGLNQNAEVMYANQAAFKLISPDIAGRPIEAFLRSSSLRLSIESAFRGETPPSLPVRILQPTERYIDVDLSRAIFIDPKNQNSAIVFAVIADRTRANIDREQRADFLANASHELKTPIASIKGYIETLRGPAKNDEIAREKFLKIMADQADRMERLVTDLLSLRRIESSEHMAPSETADLRKAVQAARDALSLLAEQKGMKLNINLPEDSIAATNGKTDECVQLFLNLMENAIKLSPKGTTVQISLERLDTWTGQAFKHSDKNEAHFRRIVNLAPSETSVWRVIITDHGPGFSRAHLPRIGERFYRVAGDLPAQEKGTGLGLAIVKHIVMRHRAGLYVNSLHASETADKVSGTSFSVIFAAKDIEP